MALHSYPNDASSNLPPPDVAKAHVVSMITMGDWLLKRCDAHSTMR
jgi:hypothetical protein